MSPFKPTDNDITAAAAACRQCGTCCRKGGPALHREDRHLVMDGLIAAEALYTIRAGEAGSGQTFAGRRSYADTDIIKIKGKGDGWCCRFLDDESSRCTIYDRRPTECKALQCWDTRAIEALYHRERLARKDLLEDAKGLWDLIADHDQRCAYHTIRRLAEQLSSDTPERAAACSVITDMVKYDESLRHLLVGKRGMPPGPCSNFCWEDH